MELDRDDGRWEGIEYQIKTRDGNLALVKYSLYFPACIYSPKIRDSVLSYACDIRLIVFQANPIKNKGTKDQVLIYLMERYNRPNSVAVIVAHPDDETLWAGGLILSQPSWKWFILSLCRGDDPDRAPKFFQALQILHAEGIMSDLDDSPDQSPLDTNQVIERIIRLLPSGHFDLIITHSPAGEYTRHRRHEETGRAVISLWHAGKIHADELWMFAYEDGQKRYLPHPIQSAHINKVLPDELWQQKYDLITRTYGFQKGGFEAKTTPRAEAFWRFTDPADAQQWLTNEVFQHEGITVI